MKPILFNTEMVRAILDGRKTVTRRAIKPHYKDGDAGFRINRRTVDGVITGVEYYDEEECGTDRYIKPPYQIGDILYVRETWARLVTAKDGEMQSERYVYKATDKYPFGESGYIVKFRWKPSIHMPKEAARIWLKVTDVRVERLQDITEEDAIKEGISPLPCHNCKATFGCDDCIYEGCTEIDGFSELWNSTIKKQDLDSYGWDANPWVWIIKFERIEQI